jgi:hypothetical protein
MEGRNATRIAQKCHLCRPTFFDQSFGQIQGSGGFSTYNPWIEQFRPTPRFACRSVPQLGEVLGFTKVEWLKGPDVHSSGEGSYLVTVRTVGQSSWTVDTVQWSENIIRCWA